MVSDKKKHAECNKIRYDWYKSHGICVNCGQEEAQKGHVYCLECRMYMNKASKKYHKGHKESRNTRNRELSWLRRERYAAAGLCAKCGKRKPAESRKYCPYCLAKAKRYMKKRRRAKGILPRHQYPELGLCMRCHKREILPGKKHCQQCYEKLLQSGTKGREKLKQKSGQYFRLAINNFWREKQAKKKPV